MLILKLIFIYLNNQSVNLLNKGYVNIMNTFKRVDLSKYVPILVRKIALKRFSCRKKSLKQTLVENFIKLFSLLLCNRNSTIKFNDAC